MKTAKNYINHLGNDEYRKTLDEAVQGREKQFQDCYCSEHVDNRFRRSKPRHNVFASSHSRCTLLSSSHISLNLYIPERKRSLLWITLGIKRIGMNEALHQYGGNGDVDGPDLETIEEAVKVVKDELDIISPYPQQV